MGYFNPKFAYSNMQLPSIGDSVKKTFTISTNTSGKTKDETIDMFERQVSYTLFTTFIDYLLNEKIMKIINPKFWVSTDSNHTALDIDDLQLIYNKHDKRITLPKEDYFKMISGYGKVSSKSSYGTMPPPSVPQLAYGTMPPPSVPQLAYGTPSPPSDAAAAPLAVSIMFNLKTPIQFDIEEAYNHIKKMQHAEGVISNSRDGTDVGVWNEQNNNRIIQILTSAPSGAVYYYFTYKLASTSARVGSYFTSIFTSSSTNSVLKKTFSWRLHIIDRLGKNVNPVELKINPTKVGISFTPLDI
jgi:hypothetical protein